MTHEDTCSRFAVGVAWFGLVRAKAHAHAPPVRKTGNRKARRNYRYLLQVLISIFGRNLDAFAAGDRGASATDGPRARE